MYRIVPIPETGYKAVWDTVTDSFLVDDNGDQAWEFPCEIDIMLNELPEDKKLELLERISLIWGS